MLLTGRWPLVRICASLRTVGSCGIKVNVKINVEINVKVNCASGGPPGGPPRKGPGWSGCGWSVLGVVGWGSACVLSSSVTPGAIGVVPRPQAAVGSVGLPQILASPPAPPARLRSCCAVPDDERTPASGRILRWHAARSRSLRRKPLPHNPFTTGQRAGCVRKPPKTFSKKLSPDWPETHPLSPPPSRL